MQASTGDVMPQSPKDRPHNLSRMEQREATADAAGGEGIGQATGKEVIEQIDGQDGAIDNLGSTDDGDEEHEGPCSSPSSRSGATPDFF